MMDATSHSFDIRASSAADRIIRNRKQIQHVRQLWIFLGSVIAFFTVVNLGRKLLAKITRSSLSRANSLAKHAAGEEKGPTAVKTSNSVSIRRLPAAVATAFRIVAFRWSLPIGPGAIASISELTFIFIYIAANLVWLLVDTRDLTALFYQDRAALLATSQLTLVVALAGKNNVLSVLTGVSHEKLNVLHRASARTSLILLWLHGITRTLSVLPKQFDFSHDFMRLGVVSLAALTLGFFLSLRPFRNAAFEFFLVSHIVLIMIFLAAGYYHAKEFDYGTYFIPAFAIWGLDRVMRIVGLVWNNRIWSRKDPSKSQATVELVSEDTIRLTLRRRFNWKPGQHAYIILPSISALPFEAHPFTIASISGSLDGTNPKEKDVVFLIRGRSGFTRRLKDHATEHGVGTVTALVDGPYGCPPDLRQFSTCILVAGGSGVSYTLPLFVEAIRQNAIGGNSAVNRIVFIWVLRNRSHLAWFSKTISEILAVVKSPLTVDTRVYITGKEAVSETRSLNDTSSSHGSSSASEKDLTLETESPAYPPIQISNGRPNIRQLLHDEIAASHGPVSVDVAGPSALTARVREALNSDVAAPGAVLKGMASVTLHVETFGMTKS